MNDTCPNYPLALPRRNRRRFYWLAGLLGLPALVLLPVHDIAQASRQAPRFRVAELGAAPHDHSHADPSGSITLGALIAAQKLARQQRAALAALQGDVAAAPAGEAWQAQLGAFRSADAAERQRARLIEAGVPAVVEQTGALHRLQSLPAIRADTEALCTRAQASGVDCFVRRAL